MAAKLWIVCQKGWEYDDNNYYCSEGVGDPLTAYRTKERAKQVATERNQARIRELFDSGEIGEYLGSDGWHSFVEERAVSLLYRLFEEYGVSLNGEYGSYQLPDEALPDQFYEKLFALGAEITFYTFTSVEMSEEK